MKSQERERRFSQKQYEFLKKCWEEGEEGIKKWNEWRRKNHERDIHLDGADFSFCTQFPLKRFWLYHTEEGKLTQPKDGRPRLEGKVFIRDANFRYARLEGTQFQVADLRGANFRHAVIRNVSFEDADMKEAWFSYAKLKNVILDGAYLRGAHFNMTELPDIDFRTALVDVDTGFFDCKFSKTTDFRRVPLDNIRIDAATKQLLKYNVRRMNWEEWYKWRDWFKYAPKEGRNKLSQFFLRNTIGWFWSISDYGISTKQIIKTFFQWALIFAAIYLAWGLIDYHLVGLKDDPGIVSNLFVLESEQETVSPWLVPFRSVYFSIVTMTTLGFGDMYANAHSFIRGLFGHALLGLQVILGYVLLGALVTRFAVLFMAGGPAGKFEEPKKEVDSVSPDNGIRGQASPE